MAKPVKTSGPSQRQLRVGELIRHGRVRRGHIGVAAHTVVEAFRDGELVIRASSTAWATQVHLLQGELRRRLAEILGEDRVTKVVVLGPAGPSWKHGLRSVKGRGPRDTYG